MNETKPPARAIVVKLGKQKKKAIKSLKRGEGKLADEALRVADAAAPAGAKEVIPVVILFRQRRKRRKAGKGLLGAMMRR